MFLEQEKDRLEDLCNQLGSENAVYEVTDVSKKETVNSLASKGIETFGKIDALINNAGIMPLSLLEKGRTDEWDEMIDINIKGVLYGINSVYSHMLERGEGQIINIASTAGKKINAWKRCIFCYKICCRSNFRGSTNGKCRKITGYMYLSWGISN